ncbi:MAG: DNA internalization-related competence protein ComEC/Rec2 [Candidatus Latescibacterota bacterium]|nr:MAG: DNA internalization-related competence protein ComEC/Rec2 [Candidatus Latescibacterota bacterium]
MALAVTPVLILQRRESRLRLAWGWLPAVLLAIAFAIPARRMPPEWGEPQVVRVDAWVASRPRTRGKSTRAWVQVERLSREAGASVAGDWRGRRLLLRARSPLPPFGGRCRVSGVLRPGRGPRNFFGYDERTHIAAHAAVGVLDAASVETLAGWRGPAWRRELVEPLRTRIVERLHATLAAREAGVLAALLVGVRDGVEREVAASWRALGISHLLAISGMHVGLVAGAVLLWAGPPRRRRGLALLLGALGAYVLLGGCGPSVVRAGIMAAWGAVAAYLGRMRRPLPILIGAVSLLLLESPERRHDLGLQLSALATCGILVWARPLMHLTRRLARWGPGGRATAWLVLGAGVSLAAQCATFPLLLLRFGAIPWSAPVANWCLVPLANSALVLALAGLPLQLLSDTLGRPLWLVAGALLHAAIEIGERATLHVDPRLYVETHPASILLAIVVAAALLGAGLCLGIRRRTAVALISLALVAACMLVLDARQPAQPSWRVEALDVGQGDALLLTLRDRVWLIDAGDLRPVDQGSSTIVPHLRRLGIRRLCGLLLSHPHRDHYGGAASVLGAVAVDTLYVARASLAANAYREVFDSAPAVPVRGVAAGDRIHLAPGYVARVLWPDASDSPQSGANAVSLVVWARGARYPDLLAMGDLEADGEAALLSRWRRDLESAGAEFLILKAGHHGSDTSSTPPLLDAADAELALVSVGRRNRYGHPSERTLTALRTRHVHVLRTDQDGAARLQLRGTTLWVERPGARPSVLESYVADSNCN